MTGSPAKPTTPLTQTSATALMAPRASGPATTSVPGGRRASSSPARLWSAMATTLGRTASAWATSASTDEWAPMATTSNRSGSAATTSRVWVPIEPVDPAMETVVREEPTRPG